MQPGGGRGCHTEVGIKTWVYFCQNVPTKKKQRKDRAYSERVRRVNVSTCSCFELFGIFVWSVDRPPSATAEVRHPLPRNASVRCGKVAKICNVAKVVDLTLYDSARVFGARESRH